MLTPKFLQRITEATEKKTAQLNSYLTRKIVDRILHVYEKTGEVNVNTAAVFDALKKQESGKLFDEIVEEIVRYMPAIEEEVREAFYDSAGKISRDMCLFTEKVLKIEQKKGELLDIDIEELPKVSDWEQIGIPRSAKDLNLTPKEIRLLEAAYKRTNGEIHNITQTTALATEQTFIDACDAAWWKATHGVSPDVAIMEAIEEVAAKGITTVHYANREEKIEVAIARAVKTGVNQANGDITLTRCAEMGVGYVLVNEHIGARVTKYEDYTNHAHWQGKVYKLDWSNPVLAKYQPTQEEIKENKKSFGFLDKIRQFLSRKPVEEYEDFITVCGYGKMLGICGINCRHSFNPFYPDININTNQGIDKQENEERYHNEQKQRAKEREIRDLKRRELALKHAEGQTENEEISKRRTELQERIQEKREEYIEFCKDKKLTRESYRLQIAKKYGVSNGDDITEIIQESAQKMKDDVLQRLKDKGVLVNIEDAGKYKEEALQSLEYMDELLSEYNSTTVSYTVTSKNFTGVDSEGGSAYMLNGKTSIAVKPSTFKQLKATDRWGLGENQPYGVLYHEFAHSLSQSREKTDSEFWKEIRKIKRNYEGMRGGSNWFDVKITDYASKDVDEFFAEAFTQAKLSNNPSIYSKQVLEVVDKYFKKDSLENIGENVTMKLQADINKMITPYEKKVLDAIPKKEGFFDFAAHGSATNIEYGSKDKVLSAREVARIIQHSEKYNGEKVRLLSCSTGSVEDGFAQQLANALGVEVEAPSDILIVAPNGSYKIGYDGSGEMKTFKPKGRK